MSNVISTTKGGEHENPLLTKIDSPSKPIHLNESLQDKISNLTLPGPKVELSPESRNRYAGAQKDALSPKPVGEEPPAVNQNTESGNANSTSSQTEPPKNANSDGIEPAPYKIQAPPKELTAKNNLSGDYGQNTDPNATGDFTYFLKNPDAPRSMNVDDMRDRYSQEKAPDNPTPTEPSDTGESDIT